MDLAYCPEDSSHTKHMLQQLIHTSYICFLFFLETAIVVFLSIKDMLEIHTSNNVTLKF